MSAKKSKRVTIRATEPGKAVSQAKKSQPGKPREIGGPKGLEPTRYGDWERKGIVSDF